MNALDQLLFQLYPYIALAVLLIGSWARFDRSMYTWRTGSSQLLSDRGMRLGSNLFHVGVLAILGGHIVGLLTPHSVYSVVLSAPQKQLLAMLVGGSFGVVCFVGISILLVRRLGNPRVRATGTFGDTLVLVLLLLQLMLGMYSITISRHHMDGSVMILLGEWAQHIVTFRWGAADFIAGVPWVYKAHVLLGMTLFLIASLHAPGARVEHSGELPVAPLSGGASSTASAALRDKAVSREFVLNRLHARPVTMTEGLKPVAGDAHGRSRNGSKDARTLGQPPPCSLFVAETGITEADIAREMQDHRGSSRPEQARADAARALVVRELLRLEVERLGLGTQVQPIGRESAEEAGIRVLLEREVEERVPSEKDCRRYYEQNHERFRSPDRIVRAPHPAHGTRRGRKRPLQRPQ